MKCMLGGSDRPSAPSDCEGCGGQGKLHRHGSYERNAEVSGGAKARVERFLCRRCGTTFGVIPEGMFPYRSLGAERFEKWMDGRFGVAEGSSAGSGARPPPASEIEKGYLLRACGSLARRIPLLCGLFGQQLALLGDRDIGCFWRALRKIGRTVEILRHLARAFKTSLLGDYRSLVPGYGRGVAPG